MHGRLDQPPPTPAIRRPAFSLVELLVVIAIIAILVSLLFPALGYCHRMAKQSREAAAGAQLMAAYTVYANDNRGSVLPGYATDAMVSGPAGSVVTDDTGTRLTGQVARRYPWRLAPALDFNFRGLYDDPAILERYQNQADRPYVVSVSPSFGINADFVGGKSAPGFGFNANATRVWGQFYITRLDQIRRSDRLLVFASARGVDASLGGGPGGGGAGDGSGVVPGFHLVNSPFLQASRWDPAPFSDSADPEAHGNVHPRHSGKANVAHADGHLNPLGLDDLRDMTRWSNQATRADWTLGSN
ncbi:MAG: type II secretion system protein [Phycisphaerae bacterium]|nr:type II secretion system protein [Phycisphaerae bacterium]